MSESLRAFGRRLKELLDDRNVTAEELSKATKIRTVFLEALFKGQRENLPNDVFIVGYLKAVLDYLRINPDPWIEEFKALSKPDDPQELRLPSNALTPVPEIRTRSHFLLWALLVLAIVACSGLYLFRMSPWDLKALLAKEEFVPAEKPASVQPPLIEQQPSDAVSGVSVPAAVEAKGLEIESLSSCWVEIRGEKGDTILKRELSAGERVAFDSQKRYDITIGDSSAVKIFFNGEEVAFDRTKDKVLRGLIVGEIKP